MVGYSRRLFGIILRYLGLTAGSLSPGRQAWIGLILVGFVSCGGGGRVFAQQDPLSNWQWRNPLPAGRDLSGACYDSGIYVAVGAGSIVTSSDGVRWTQRYGGDAGLKAVTYGDGRFVAVGNRPDWASVIVTSTNGIDWASMTHETANGPNVILENVAFGNGRFVAVGVLDGSYYDAWSMASSNGIDWTAQPTGSASILSGITFAQEIFVAVGYNYQSIPETYENRILTSADGVSWIEQSAYSLSTLSRVTYGNGQFVAVGESYPYADPLIYTSTNGSFWVERYYGGELDLNDVAYGNGLFVATGFHWNGAAWRADMLASKNGIDWQAQDASALHGLPGGVAWGAGVFATVGSYGEIITSSDGSSWTNQLHGIYGKDWDLNGVVANSNVVVTVGGNWDGWPGGILCSTNGVDWINRSAALTNWTFQDVIYAQDKFVAVGGVTALSSNGVDWGVADYAGYNAVAYGNGIYVAVGGWCDFEHEARSSSATSADGRTWTECDDCYAPTNGILRSVAYGNGVFVAVGTGDNRDEIRYCDYYGPPVVTSTDGANWTPVTLNASFVAVAFGSGRFVALDGNGDAWTSLDGQSWVHQTNISRNYPEKLVYVNHTFFAPGPMATSPDGVNWESHSAGVGFNSLTYFNGSYIGVSVSGAIQQSDPAPPENLSCRLSLTFNGLPSLALSGAASRAVRIESSSDPAAPNSWQALTNLYPSASPFYWTDPQAAAPRQRFYRAVVLP